MRADARGAAVARRFVADVLLQRGFPDVAIDNAVLLASEAATYALSLGSEMIGLAVHANPAMGRVEVHLLDRHERPTGSMAPDDPEGRGFLVLEALAEDWGLEPDGPGARCVWFEVRP